MARKKIYTARDVDSLIPRLEQIFQHIEECRHRAEALAAAGTAPDPHALRRAQFLLQAVEVEVTDILRLGGVVKDLDQGLVDFPGQVDGQDVWLCWKRGESAVRFWHALDQGFGQRQALRRQETGGRPTYH